MMQMHGRVDELRRVNSVPSIRTQLWADIYCQRMAMKTDAKEAATHAEIAVDYFDNAMGINQGETDDAD